MSVSMDMGMGMGVMNGHVPQAQFDVGIDVLFDNAFCGGAGGLDVHHAGPSIHFDYCGGGGGTADSHDLGHGHGEPDREDPAREALEDEGETRHPGGLPLTACARSRARPG